MGSTLAFDVVEDHGFEYRFEHLFPVQKLLRVRP